MKRKQGRDDAYAVAVAQTAPRVSSSRSSLLRLEAVAGLHLDGGATALHQGVEAAPALIEQVLVRRCSRSALDRRGNAASGLGDFLVTGTGAAHRMLVRSCSAEDQVGVAVDEARRDPGCRRALSTGLGTIAGKLGPAANADDLAVGDADRAVFNDPERIVGRGLQVSRCCSRRAAGPTCAAWASRLGGGVSGQSVGRLAEPFRPDRGPRGQPRGRRDAWCSTGGGIGHSRRVRPGAGTASADAAPNWSL